ncbi:hypothetical protein AN958_04792 [Leucoagaricus sp. SymC.cos]|nr:hypothetical protein AN958_04792 [Leucoagaricus sp. SymC.cos]
MSETIHHRTTNPYESLFGYCRGVRKGPFIFISGTTSTSTHVGRALKESLGDIEPAATMVVGAGFVNKDMKVEIEADAVAL